MHTTSPSLPLCACAGARGSAWSGCASSSPTSPSRWGALAAARALPSRGVSTAWERVPLAASHLAGRGPRAAGGGGTTKRGGAEGRAPCLRRVTRARRCCFAAPTPWATRPTPTTLSTSSCARPSSRAWTSSACSTRSTTSTTSSSASTASRRVRARLPGGAARLLPLAHNGPRRAAMRAAHADGRRDGRFCCRALAAGGIAEATLCYTGDVSDPRRTRVRPPCPQLASSPSRPPTHPL